MQYKERIVDTLTNVKDWGGGTSGVYQLYELASGSNRDNIIGAIKSIIEDRSVDPKVVAELIQIASDFDISQVDEHVENVLKNSTMMSHEPVKQPWIVISRYVTCGAMNF